MHLLHIGVALYECCTIKKQKNMTTSEVNSVREKIRNLHPYICGKRECNYEMNLRMVNGKEISTLTGVPSQNCHFCGAKPSAMNDINNCDKTAEPDKLRYGLTTMHAWIKCMEHIMHVSDYLQWKKPTIRGATQSERKAVVERKRETRVALIK